MGSDGMFRGEIKHYLLYLLFLFVIVSIAGWCVEIMFRSAFLKHLTIPGFLYGPYCPIYGFGIVSVTLACKNDRKWVAFVKIFFLASILEYVVSAVFEHMFHVLLWDYSMIPFSIGTRVSLIFSLIWGFFGMLAVREAEPRIRQFYIKHKKKADILAMAALAVIVTDAAVSVWMK